MNQNIKSKKPYLSPYQPLVAVDILIFTIINSTLEILLVKRKYEPFKNYWSIPGGFVKKNESLEQAATRELKEETNINNVYLEQLYTFGDPHRDPRDRVISVSYFALVPSDKTDQIKGRADVLEAGWHSTKDLPSLAFDHDKIITYALQRLRWKLEYTNVVYSLLAEEFTLTDMQKIYEIIFDKTFDKRNFRKKILSLSLIQPTGKKVIRGIHRPASTYRFTEKNISLVDIT